jgi:EF-hand domain pair
MRFSPIHPSQQIFAVSYSIAGLNVLSGNPVDHFVHRHTHRVTRGSLVLCGRPDGRLSALSTAEAAVCLSVNQASSIQSWGGTCESVTIGHNPSKLPLSANAIFLKRKRPLFLCERMLVETDVQDEARLDALSETQHSTNSRAKPDFFGLFRFRQERNNSDPLDFPSTHDPSIRPRVNKYRTAAALLGVYTSDEANTDTQASDEDEEDRLIVDKIVEEAIREKKFSDRAHILFQTFDKHGRGTVTEDQFIEGTLKLKTGLTEDELRALFKLYDQDGESVIDYHEFLELMNDAGLGSGIQLPPSNRDKRGIIRIQPSKEKYFGQNIRKHNEGKSGRDLDFSAARSQHFVQELYETRIASMQRFVAITVMSHQMGKRVEQFFRRISFGSLGYRMDRTHSIMRIATTASPVSGADVKEQMRHMQLLKRVQHSVHVISLAYLRYKATQQTAPVPSRNTVDTE